MKKCNFFLAFGLVLTLSLGVSSCSQDDVLEVNEQKGNVALCTTRAEANMVLSKYLELNNEQYTLSISAEEAEKLGVPFGLYEDAQRELSTTNALIQKLKNDPNTILELTDPKVAPKSRSNWDTPSLYSAPTGTLRTNGQEEVMSGFVWAPSGTKGIEFLCRANAALTPLYNCKTYSSGAWQSKSAVGALGVNTTVQVPLYVSNDNIRVAFSTSDSNGGTATYQGYN